MGVVNHCSWWPILGCVGARAGAWPKWTVKPWARLCCNPFDAGVGGEINNNNCGHEHSVAAAIDFMSLDKATLSVVICGLAVPTNDSIQSDSPFSTSHLA